MEYEVGQRVFFKTKRYFVKVWLSMNMKYSWILKSFVKKQLAICAYIKTYYESFLHQGWEICHRTLLPN